MRKAALVLATSVAFLLSVTSTYAATRQTVNHGQTARNIITGQSATTGTVSTPAGAAAYFGQEYTSYHSAGERFNAGDSPGGSGSGSGSKQSVKVTPGAFVNKAKAAAKAVSAVKGGIPGVIAMLAIDYAMDQLPGAVVVDGQPMIAPQPSSPTVYGNPLTGSNVWETKEKACLMGNSYWNGTIPAGYYVIPEASSPGKWDCHFIGPGGYSEYKGTAQALTLNCPYGHNGVTCNTQSSPSPFTDANWDSLEDAISQVENTDWFRDMIEASCEGSLNPDGCYNDLVDNPFMIGPATQTGPAKTTTSTTTNPDGTTSTTTTTSTPSYSYTYGDTYYDYDTTVTTTTNNNGQVTTTVQTDTQEGEPEEDPSEDEEDDLAPPDLNDPYQPVVTKYNSIAGEVTASAPVDASVNYSPWYSFGGSCTEIQAELPIYGNWSTNYCPLVNDWVRPILSFLLILFTWHTCYDMWREALRIGRPI